MRRTDKDTEAAFYGIDEYMVHVEEWYEQLSLTQTVEQKRVFIATDEPTVIKEAKEKSDFIVLFVTEVMWMGILTKKY